MKIREVFPGTAAAPNARYVMLQMYFAGQNFVAGHYVVFYDATGAETIRFPFTDMVANGADQATILIATTEAQALFGITPDLTMTAAAMMPAGGKVCFDAIPFDCVSWGNYSGSTEGVGNPFNPSGGLTQGQAARRRIDIAGSPTTLEAADDRDDSATDFVVAVPAPRNNAGQTGTLAAPTTLSATATGTASVALSWAASSGATMYEVHRSASVSGMYMVSVTTSDTSALDSLPLDANTTYLYKVRALGSSGSSPFSTVDAATTTTFDDTSLTSLTGVVIKAVHITQTRTAVNAMRVAAALAPVMFNDSSLSGVVIKAEHVTELRNALDAARSAIGLPAIVYEDPTITPGVTTVTAGHVLQVRSGTQ